MSLADLQKRRRKTPRLRRGLPRKQQMAVRSYGTAVGELVWASNHCLNHFNLLYREIFSKDDIKIAVRTWHTGRSDSSQLDMVEAAANGSRMIRLSTVDEIVWAIVRARKLSEKRNDAVHSTTTFHMKRPNSPVKVITSSISTLPSRFEKLSVIRNLARHFRVVRNDFIQLTNYVYYLWNEVAFPGYQPLPKRPRLRSVPEDSEKKKLNRNLRHQGRTLRP